MKNYKIYYKEMLPLLFWGNLMSLILFLIMYNGGGEGLSYVLLFGTGMWTIGILSKCTFKKPQE